MWVKAAILGAESFGFGSTPMIALGCKYLRICHLNNCATGVATQARSFTSRTLYWRTRNADQLLSPSLRKKHVNGWRRLVLQA